MTIKSHSYPLSFMFPWLVVGGVWKYWRMAHLQCLSRKMCKSCTYSPTLSKVWMIPGIQGLVHICLGVIRHAHCSCSIADSDLYLLVHTSHSRPVGTDWKKLFFPIVTRCSAIPLVMELVWPYPLMWSARMYSAVNMSHWRLSFTG